MNFSKYRDFKKEYFNYNSWKKDSSFPIKEESKENVCTLNNYEIIEYFFKGVEENRDNIDLFEDKFSDFKRGLIKELFKMERDNIYIYSIEHKKKKRSRIRSYKGLLDKKNIEYNIFYEKEINLKNEESIICFIAYVNKENIKYLLKYFFDDSTSFVIKSNKNYLNQKFVDLISDTLDFETNIELNYLKLMKLLCSIGDIIYRIGGNSGEDYWSLQKFQRIPSEEKSVPL